MPILKREVDYAKEIDDVPVLLIGIVKDVKAGKPAAEVLLNAIPKLSDALSALDQADDEFKLNRKAALQTVLFRAGELVDVLLPVVK